jgi:hypothetical protein
MPPPGIAGAASFSGFSATMVIDPAVTTED